MGIRKSGVLIILLTSLIISACQNETVDLENLVADHLKPIEGTLSEKSEFTIVDATRHEGELTEDGEAVIVPETDIIDVIVNKERRLPNGYEPEDLMIADVDYHAVNEERKHLREEAAGALEDLFEAASEEGHQLVAVSGYRSEQTQEVVFASNVDRHGEEHAEQYSAQPGYSEHQTGLAMDVSTASIGYALSEEFGETQEGKWVAENGHKHGFIIRYLEGKSEITGYGYEPWHLRYVGEDLATSVYQSGLTLEEYFGLVE
ncbi:M15 family metallopeptidase [Alkalibacillus silvisoli]|uniref:LD-carboxypeptidase LdcB n=1 Tax=Alkalibacillus silvisoli TaxID=392823 RepID=A0ABN1A9M9_9BACI